MQCNMGRQFGQMPCTSLHQSQHQPYSHLRQQGSISLSVSVAICRKRPFSSEFSPAEPMIETRCRLVQCDTRDTWPNANHSPSTPISATQSAYRPDNPFSPAPSDVTPFGRRTRPSTLLPRVLGTFLPLTPRRSQTASRHRPTPLHPAIAFRIATSHPNSFTSTAAVPFNLTFQSPERVIGRPFAPFSFRQPPGFSSICQFHSSHSLFGLKTQHHGPIRHPGPSRFRPA